VVWVSRFHSIYLCHLTDSSHVSPLLSLCLQNLNGWVRLDCVLLLSAAELQQLYTEFPEQDVLQEAKQGGYYLVEDSSSAKDWRRLVELSWPVLTTLPPVIRKSLEAEKSRRLEQIRKLKEIEDAIAKRLEQMRKVAADTKDKEIAPLRVLQESECEENRKKRKFAEGNVVVQENRKRIREQPLQSEVPIIYFSPQLPLPVSSPQPLPISQSPPSLLPMSSPPLLPIPISSPPQLPLPISQTPPPSLPISQSPQLSLSILQSPPPPPPANIEEIGRHAELLMHIFLTYFCPGYDPWLHWRSSNRDRTVALQAPGSGLFPEPKSQPLPTNDALGCDFVVTDSTGAFGGIIGHTFYLEVKSSVSAWDRGFLLSRNEEAVFQQTKCEEGKTYVVALFTCQSPRVLEVVSEMLRADAADGLTAQSLRQLMGLHWVDLRTCAFTERRTIKYHITPTHVF